MADNPTARAAHRRAADAGRKAAESAGARPTKVSVITKTYSAGIGFAGTTLVSTTTLVLSPRPKVISGASVSSYFGGGRAAGSSGRLEANQYLIGPITLSYPGGGYTTSQIVPLGSDRIEVSYLLEGPEFLDGGELFDLVSVDATRPHQVMIVVQRAPQ